MVLQSLLDDIKDTDVKLHVLYDIACMLDTHIKVDTSNWLLILKLYLEYFR